MNITSSTVYWITRLDSLNVTLILITLFLSFWFIGNVIAYAVCSDERYDFDKAQRLKFRASFRNATPWLVLVCLADVFTPTTKEAAAIIVIPAVANSTELQGLGKDIIVLAREWIKEEIKNEDDEKKDKK